MRSRPAIVLVFVVIIGLVYPATVSHATMIAFYSDGVIQEGDMYDIVEVYDTPPAQTTVDMTGGQVGYPGMSTFDTSVVNILGGFVGFLQTNDSSTANISGGWVADPVFLEERTIGAHNQSTINVYDEGFLTGWSFSFFELYDSSTLRAYPNNP